MSEAKEVIDTLQPRKTEIEIRDMYQISKAGTLTEYDGERDCQHWVEVEVAQKFCEQYANAKLIEFQNFLILDGQLDIEADEVKRNAEIFLNEEE